MSDINYDPTICRNIMVDIRYVLFIVDKFAGAKNLIAEMVLVHPKKGKKGQMVYGLESLEGLFNGLEGLEGLEGLD